MITDLKPETIVILSPHSLVYSDYFHISPGRSARGNFGSFGAGGVAFEINYDTEFAAELSRQAKMHDLSAGTMGERDKSLDHGTMVPLYFIRDAYGGDIKCRIVRIGLSGLPLSEHYRLGMLIKKTSEMLDLRVGIVASGDLSHVLKEDGPYGYREEGPVYDRLIMDVMSRASFGDLFGFSEAFCGKAGECGHQSFVIMAGCFDGMAVKSENFPMKGLSASDTGSVRSYPKTRTPAGVFLMNIIKKLRNR